MANFGKSVMLSDISTIFLFSPRKKNINWGGGGGGGYFNFTFLKIKKIINLEHFNAQSTHDRPNIHVKAHSLSLLLANNLR